MTGFRRVDARAAHPSNPVVALDFAHAQSLLALDIKSFGLADRWRYTSAVEEPSLPTTVFDVGRFSEPNLELLAEIRPQVILHSREWPVDTEQLRRIAPLLEASIYTGAPAALGRARQALLRIAEATATDEKASNYLSGFAERMAEYRSHLEAFREKRFICIWSATPRDFWALGTASLVHDVFNHLGFSNIVEETGDTWGWLPLTTRRLTELEGVMVVHFGAIPPILDQNLFWSNLGFVRSKHLVILPRSWLFGGLPEAERIAHMTAQALKGHGHRFVK